MSCRIPLGTSLAYPCGDCGHLVAEHMWMTTGFGDCQQCKQRKGRRLSNILYLVGSLCFALGTILNMIR